MLTEDSNNASYIITAYSDFDVKINNTTYQKSLIISLDKLITDWSPASTTEIQPADLQQIITLNPEIILIGTGKCGIMLPAAVLAPLIKSNYNVECMSTAAACRTYAALSAEGRKVAAALIIEISER